MSIREDNINNESTLKLPQTEFNAILNSIPDVIIRFDLNSKVVWWNKNLEDVISYSNDKLLELTCDDLFSLCDACNIKSIITETITNNSAEVDAFLTTNDGRKRYHLKSSLVVASSEQEILIVGRDIDEREKMSDALRQSQKELQQLIDTLPFIVFLTKTNNEFILANKQFCNITGLSHSEIIGKNISEVFNENITEHLVKDNDKILIDKIPIHYETALEVNRHNMNLSVDKFPLFNSDAEIYAICGVVENVTSQYQMQRKLQQTQKMEAIGQLTGGIAHDFNNILASIMGYTGLTKRRVINNNDETVNGYLSQIIRASERARDLVQQLLAFSRGDVAGSQILNPEPLAKEAIKMLASLIPSSIDLKLKVRNNNLKYYVQIDPVQFNQSVMNLVINAKDAITDKIGDINVSLEYMPNVNGICDSCHASFSGKYIQLAVKDSGTGINKNILERIFDPFFTTKDVGKGSGMGLSMLHGIVHSSGGHIVVNSNNKYSKNGTTIQVYLPEVKNQQIEEQGAKYITETVENKNTGKNILIIDDEPLLTNYLSALLEGEGFKTVTFNDPFKGLDFFKENPSDIDIIITDQTMPGLTGLELGKKLMSLDYQVPIILCTGYSNFGDDIIISDYGISALMNKPFDDKLLFQNISTLLS